MLNKSYYKTKIGSYDVMTERLLIFLGFSCYKINIYGAIYVWRHKARWGPQRWKLMNG